MKKRKLNILINKMGVIPFDCNTDEINLKSKLIFLTELCELGYTVENVEDFNNSVLNNYKWIIKALKHRRGADVNYVPLFKGFPNSVPDENEYFVKRIMGYIGNFIGMFDHLDEDYAVELDNKIKVPKWLFDVENFGADPITQFQDENLYKKGVESQNKREKDSNLEIEFLKLVDKNKVDDILKDYLKSILYSKSSVKESLKNDIEYLLKEYGVFDIDFSKIIFKEIKTTLMEYFWKKEDYEKVSKLINTSTDILRLFASLTDSDISLSEKIKFPKLSRKQRRFILFVLDDITDIDNINIYKGLWIAVGNVLHPGEYKHRFPNAYNIFDIIRNKKVITYNSKLEKFIKEKDIDSILQLLNRKPGVFGRKIHHILEIAEKCNREKDVLDKFKLISCSIELKNLLIMNSYFETIENSDIKSIFNKKGKMIVMENKKNRLKNKTVDELLLIIKSTIKQKINSDFDSWEDKKIWIDERIADYNIPLKQRKVQEGMITVGRGSKITFEKEDKILRLFVYWKEKELTTDYDLSLIELNDNMEYNGHVSYTNLKDEGIIHSGDIQSAPHGASEFIDIDLNKVKSKYLVMVVYRYRGSNFADIDCHAGWMFRKDICNKHKTFDTRTVSNKFNINGVANYTLPIIVDTMENKIIYSDLYVGSCYVYNNVEKSNEIFDIVKALIKFNKTKPNMFDLAKFHCEARGAILNENKEDVDITIGLKDCDYNVLDVEKILSDLL